MLIIIDGSNAVKFYTPYFPCYYISETIELSKTIQYTIFTVYYTILYIYGTYIFPTQPIFELEKYSFYQNWSEFYPKFIGNAYNAGQTSA